MTGFIILAVLLFVTSILSLVIAISARRVDLTEHILNRRFVRAIITLAEKRREEREKEEISGVPFEKKKSKEDIVATETAPSPLIGRVEDKKYEEMLEDLSDEEIYAHKAKKEGEEPEKIAVAEEAFYTRDVTIKIPKNMCLNEIFRLEITLLKSEKFGEEVEIQEKEVDAKEARRYAITVKKLGKVITEATVQITGLQEGPLTIRPLTIGRFVHIAPSSRKIYFNPEAEKITVDFYVTPIRWTKDVVTVLKIEFEQNYRIIKSIDLPIKIYKYKFEALFGINLSKWHQYGLFAYSILGTLAGLLSAFQSKVIPWIQQLLG